MCIFFPGSLTVTSNEVQINVVTNSIAPTTTQNILTNTNGSLLTVTETPTATSREWKYTTTSGSGYTSFGTAETGTTYTPNFSTAGTYYVVCVSSFPSSLAVTSNEVQINVVTNSIAPTTTQNILTNTNGSLLTVTETPTATSREWKYTTTSGSGYTSFGTAETGTTYTPNFSTAGTYYVVCVSSFPGSLTVTSNEVQINVVTNSIAPATAQNILINTNGNLLTVTETPTATSREWKYTTTSGSGYTSFGTAETGTTYTPNFSTAGTYYVVCVSSFPGSLTVTSNEVQINVVTNSIAPATAQNILTNTNGNLLTVTETPTATSREWKYTTTSGSGYTSFGTAETGTTYTPNFSTAGTYYVVCVSSFPGSLTVTSNEVQINVVTNSIAPTTTQNILTNTNGSLLTVTETPTAVSREWKYTTTSGSSYTSFGIAETGTTYTPNFSTAGTYYVVCVSSFPGSLTVTSNEVQINAVANSIAPASAQSILINSNGNLLTVTESPAGTSREWKFSTTSGSGYTSFGVAETGTTYTPNFNGAGNYYIICESVINGLTAISNEVLISVSSVTLSTGTIAGSPFEFSPHATDASISVPYTTSSAFNGGNIFSAQLSDANGSFASATNIGSVTATSSGDISATIPSSTPAGTRYRIRVIADNPSVFGTDNGTDLIVDQFHNSVAPSATQTIMLNTNGTAITVTASQTATQEWKYSTTSGGVYMSFGTIETGISYTPNFATPGTYYVACLSVNQYNDTVTSNEVQINVVTNSIAPTTTQNILTNTNGTLLTVTETPTAISREWKYTTTSGSGYTSFGTAETGTTYTPNFSTAGTYYVVCVSSFPSSLAVTSNEVQINVVTNSIAPTTTQNILTNTNGTLLTVTETPTATSREWKYTTTSGSGYTSFGVAETGTTYTPNFSTAGTYYVVCVSSFPGSLTVISNEVQINVVTNSIAPTTTQNILTNTNGTLLTVTETPTAISREWKYTTTSGSGYTSFGTAETGTTYTPNFSTAGTYYVVCVSSYPGSLTVASNEVQINVVANGIAPASAQNILINSNGSLLTVTESPVGTSREWKFSTTSGSGYASFGVVETGTTYTPNFSSAGNYYIICESVINGLTATSNEVLISVSSVTLSTGAIIGSPFEFSPHATDASISVPYTTSSAFNAGNIFSAQLSDANGSFASATNIGSITATGSGNISATIPASTPAGTGYRIRVIADNPSVFGTDNGTNLIVDQFHNSVAPTATQTIMRNTSGTAITVTASQSATQEWKYSMTSGGVYTSFGTIETGISYTPNFATPGTYYVVCLSVNQYNDTVISNEIEIDVQNGTVISTSTISGSPFLISASAHVQVNVDFTSDAVFNSANVFKAQLSDENGSFSNPTEIGTLDSSAIGTIPATIPNSAAAGSAYRIRVISTDPAITGTDNGADLEIIPFELAVSPTDTQWVTVGVYGDTITASATQPCTYQWMYTVVSGTGYADFNPVQTNAAYVPNFASANIYYVICKMTNSYLDEITSQEVVIIAQEPNGIGELAGTVKVFSNQGQVVVDLQNSTMKQPFMELINMNGQVVLKQRMQSGAVNTISQTLLEGVYLFRLTDGNNTNTGKLLIR
ncbi:MAG: T9SS type A sorting domain-containing protein [Bacteroidetes bacterium]|nr:T9SS type A sorting domain-containing protein [Bacteroidota bacterium]